MKPGRKVNPIESHPGEVAEEKSGATSQRLDKWLWFTRAVKSRTVAAGLVEAGKIRVNAVKVVKPSHALKAGDVVTSSAQRDVRILRVAGLGSRRGPAAEAQLLYEDLTPKPVKTDSSGESRAAANNGQREPGSGRPTKRDRRLLERLQGHD
jgi:ribosome-associated heat shock protein Hsp15